MRAPFKMKEHQDLFSKGYVMDPSIAPTCDDDYLKKAKWAYSLWCSNLAFTRPGGYIGNPARTIGELRAYARGRQYSAKYREVVTKALTDSADPNLQAAASPQNVSWENTRVAEKFLAIARSKIASMNFDPEVCAYDSFSNAERNRAIAADRLAATPQMQQLAQQVGVPLTINPIAQAMQNDIEAAANLGAYLLPVEAQLQDACMITLNATDWLTIKNQMIDDLLEIGFAGFDTTFSQKEKAVKIKYIDPAGAIIPVSAYADCRDVPFAGYIEDVTIASIREDIVEKYGEASEQILYGMATQYGNYYPNVRSRANMGANFRSGEFRRDFAATNGRQVYDTFMVSIMHLKFMAVQEIEGSHVPFEYQVKWVIGTNYVFDASPVYGQAREGRPGSVKSLSSCGFYVLPGSSMVEKIVPFIDDLEIATRKLRLLMANMPAGPNRSIDLARMNSVVQVGSKEYNLLDLLAVERATGTLIFSSTNEFDDPSRGSQASPIQPQSTGIEGPMTIVQTAIINAVNDIRNTTGVNEAADGSASPQDMLGVVMTNLNQAANAALSSEFLASNMLHMMAANRIVKKYQSVIVDGEITLTETRQSIAGLHAVTLTKDISLRDLRITVKLAPSQDDIAMAMQMAVARLQENKITQADMLVVFQMLRAGNWKLAQLYMAKAIATQERVIAQQAAQNQMAQAAAQSELAKIQAEAKQRELTLEYQLKAEFEKLKNELDIRKMETAQRLGISSKAFEIEAGQLAIS